MNNDHILFGYPWAKANQPIKSRRLFCRTRVHKKDECAITVDSIFAYCSITLYAVSQSMLPTEGRDNTEPES